MYNCGERKVLQMKKSSRVFFCLLCALIGVSVEVIVGKLANLGFQDVLYMTLTVVCIETCVIIAMITGIEDLKIKEVSGIYKVAYIRKSVWLKSNIVWMVVNFWMISSAFLSTLIVIYISVNNIDARKIVFYSIMSLFTSIMQYVLTPMAMARGYRKAYQIIDKAILSYEKNGCKDIEILEDALNLGEGYIEKYSYKIKS